MALWGLFSIEPFVLKGLGKGISDLAVACEDIQRISSGDNGVTVTTVTPKRTAKPFSTFIQKGLPQRFANRLSLLSVKCDYALWFFFDLCDRLVELVGSDLDK